MGYFVTYEGKFVGDRHSLHKDPSYAKYRNHPSEVRTMINQMRNKGYEGTFKVFRWSSKEDVTDKVIQNGS